MTDNFPLPVATRSPLRNFFGSLAVLTIAITGWFIWQQRADAQRPRGLRSQGPGLTPSAPRFDMSQAKIPVDKVMHGGPPKDGIPALTNPKFVKAADATFLAPEDKVIGVANKDQSKAYPLKILDSHEAVNDHLGEQPVAVTYCPLCDSSAVFDRRLGGQEVEFGISGLLFNSNVLMYDRAATGPESLWSQMAASAVTSQQSGQQLRRLPLEVTTWSDWNNRYPGTLVLSTETGYERRYQQRGYQEYFTSPQLMFPMEPLDDRLPAKTPVLGVTYQEYQRAYPLSTFAKRGQRDLTDQIAGKQLTLRYDSEHESLRVVEADAHIQWMYSFWFAWSAFYPETTIWQPE